MGYIQHNKYCQHKRFRECIILYKTIKIIQKLFNKQIIVGAIIKTVPITQPEQYIYMYINHRFKLFGRFKFKEGLLPKYTNKYHIYIKYFDSNAKRLN